MKFIETTDEWVYLNNFIKNKDISVFPILEDHLIHPVMNKPCILCIFVESELFVISLSHPEINIIESDIISLLNSPKKIYTSNKKALLQIYPNITAQIIDFQVMEYLYNGEVIDTATFLTPIHKMLHSRHYEYSNVNSTIPIMQHIVAIERMNEYYNKILNNELTNTAFEYINDIAIPALQYIEQQGICIDRQFAITKYGNRLERYLTDNNLIYSEYNLYTKTGRCSNRFGGINFAAVSKKDGSRAMIISRFSNGKLFNVDFDSFHIRLIAAELLDYKFPDNIKIHEYFGKQYFQKEHLSEKEYEESKAKTFQLLYGIVRNQNIPDFFKKVYAYIDRFDNSDYIESPLYKRRIYKDHVDDPSSSKMFNYLIQMIETERNLTILNDLIPLCEKYKVYPILYTYDSLLFDTEQENIPLEILDKLTEDNKYPVRIHSGKTYQDMKLI